MTSRVEGRRRLVTAADSAVFRPLRDLMGIVYGVPAVIAEEFGGLEASVTIFGSWAARWQGEPGPVPGDVDVLVVGEADSTDAWAAASRATDRLGIEVNVVARTSDEWADDTSGFAQEVRSGPRIELTRPDKARGDDA